MICYLVNQQLVIVYMTCVCKSDNCCYICCEFTLILLVNKACCSYLGYEVDFHNTIWAPKIFHKWCFAYIFSLDNTCSKIVTLAVPIVCWNLKILFPNYPSMTWPVARDDFVGAYSAKCFTEFSREI